MKVIISTRLKSQSATNIGKSIQRLEEIRDEILSLVEEAGNLVRKAAPGVTYTAAKSYWISHIKAALVGYGASRTSATTMQDTIDYLIDEEES